MLLVGVLVPQSGIEPTAPLAVTAGSPNHWTARGFPNMHYFSSQKNIS